MGIFSRLGHFWACLCIVLNLQSTVCTRLSVDNAIFLFQTLRRALKSPRCAFKLLRDADVTAIFVLFPIRNFRSPLLPESAEVVAESIFLFFGIKQQQSDSSS